MKLIVNLVALAITVPIAIHIGIPSGIVFIGTGCLIIGYIARGLNI